MDDDERTQEEIEADREKKKETSLVLVGFGSNKLGDMLEWIDTPREIELLTAFKKWPPVYRREAICEPADIQDACDFLAFLQDAILEYELNNPPGDKENKDGNG